MISKSDKKTWPPGYGKKQQNEKFGSPTSVNKFSAKIQKALKKGNLKVTKK